jgi:hypothetical protein
MSSRKTHLTVAALACCSAIAAGATAAAAQDAPAPPASTVTVRQAPALRAGMTSPFDVAGVKAIRRGKPIPSGYALVGRTVTVNRAAGAPAAGAALRFLCPGHKRLRSFAVTGSAGFAATDAHYPGKRSTVVTSLTDRNATGSIYAVCR